MTSSDGNFGGVKISPPIVEFFDADADIVHQMNVCVQNLSKNSKHIRFLAPATDHFRLQAKFLEKTIAPGLEVSALVEYYNDKDEDCQDRIIFMIDEDFVEVPVLAYAPKSTLTISGPVDFGTIVADGKVLTQEISILNHGSKDGQFSIALGDDCAFQVMPLEGSIRPGYSQPVRFEFISKQVGVVKQKIAVNFEGQSSAHINAHVNVVARSLLLLALDQDNDTSCVQFGACYYGTDVVQEYRLFNAGPEDVNFVVVLDEEGEGQEFGVDITKSAMTTFHSSERAPGHFSQLTSLVSTFPSQGVLRPYEKRSILFKFSPRHDTAATGWCSTDKPPPRKDYALFMSLQAVGIVADVEAEAMRIEVALTGTALPVLMSVLPSSSVHFESNCIVGESQNKNLRLRNDSPTLPICFTTDKIAHFHPNPSYGFIGPSEILDLAIVFKPHQIGNHSAELALHLVGQVCDTSTGHGPVFKKVKIRTYILNLEGISPSIVSKKQSSSKQKVAANESTMTGVHDGMSLQVFNSKDTRGGDLSKETTVQTVPGSGENKKSSPTIAQPNDLATSIRPSDRNEIVMTKFTGTQRYSYVDQDYTFTDQEQQAISEHSQQYTNYLRKQTDIRTAKQEAVLQKQLNNDLDLGMKSQGGLKPPKVSLKQAEKSSAKTTTAGEKKKKADRLLSSKEIDRHKQKAAKKKVLEGLKAIPLTLSEQEDCSRILTPQELYQVAIEPKTIDFGEVCIRSVSQKEVKIMNNLPMYIYVQVQIDCRELRQTSPISQVVPPHSVAKLQFIFESTKHGKFERSVPYHINGHHESHLILLTDVVSLALELSAAEVTLLPLTGMSAESGLRKTVTLFNKRNSTAEFSWSPVIGKDGTSFSIRPAKGAVEAFSSLECEVAFYPSYSACLDGSFMLSVEQGNQLQLSCNAKIGTTSVSFVERRLMFGAIPLNLMTTRSAFLRNTSTNHAYFKVVDVHPISGMTVAPFEGVVPIGGTAELKVFYKPEFLQKFDTEIAVHIRGWKTVTLRMGGHVEPPSVDIDIADFNFGGIYGGAKSAIPFNMCNLNHSEAQMMFDLSLFRDFTLRFPGLVSQLNKTRVEDDRYFVSLTGQEHVQGVLEFQPSEVAAYDFELPVTVNNLQAPAPSPSPYPDSIHSENSIKTITRVKVVQSFNIEHPTPSRRVLATGMRAPLQLSTKQIDFRLPSGYFDLHLENMTARAKSLVLVNNSDQQLAWLLDCSAVPDNMFQFLYRIGSPHHQTPDELSRQTPCVPLESGETYELQVLYNPETPGMHAAKIPLIMNNDHDHPYCEIALSGTLETASIEFEPSKIEFQAVPLQTPSEQEIKVIAKGYRNPSRLLYECPEIELENGGRMQLLTVEMLSGDTIEPCCREMGNVEPFTFNMKISFQSPHPVLFSTSINFFDGEKNYALPVTAVADNCLLTTYNFLSSRQTDFHIVCEKLQAGEANETDEIVFVPCVSPIRPPTNISCNTTSTPFSLTVSSFEELSPSALSSSTSEEPNMTGGERPSTDDEDFSPYDYRMHEPEAESDEEKYLREILKTLQRWYSSQGWAGGPSPLNLPDSLRSAFSRSGDDNHKTRAGSWNREGKTEAQTVFDIVAHLCGKPIPGLPVNFALPEGGQQRVDYIYWAYQTLLTFLRCQGGMTSLIRVEHLFDTDDYNLWIHLNSDEEAPTASFEYLSRKAWTDLLLQILKVLVLSRITPQSYKKQALPDGCIAPLPPFNADPVCSNVYGIGERVVLAWLNYHYEQQRKCAENWKHTYQGESPPSRWIVNFENDFMDGLVLASLLVAYAPYVISTHLSSLYTHPTTAEQCLHNVLKVVDTFRFLGFDYDVLATDITEANSCSILLLCIFLYFNLPKYLSRSVVEFVGPLHSTVTKHVSLRNPSAKPLIYQAILASEYSSDFNIPSGKQVQVPPKGSVELAVEWKSRFLRACSGTLILVGRRIGSAVGSTLVFTLECVVDSILPMSTIKCESPCYELQKIMIPVSNPFATAAEFRVVTVESTESLIKKPVVKKLNVPKVHKAASKIDARWSNTKKERAKEEKKEKKVPPPREQESSSQSEALLNTFWTPHKSIHLEAYGAGTIELQYLPFHVGTRQCSVLLLDDMVGEFLYSVEATSSLPLPSLVPFQSDSGVRVTSAMAVHQSQGTLVENDRVVYLHCSAGAPCSEELTLPACNQAKEQALVLAAKQRMSDTELRRRHVTGMISGETIISLISNLTLKDRPLFRHPVDEMNREDQAGILERFTISLSSPFFKAPECIFLPASGQQQTAEKELVKLPVTVLADEPGQYACTVVLESRNDVRVYQIECTLKPPGSTAELEFSSPTHQSVVQDVPIVNHSPKVWELDIHIRGEGFSGPPHISAPAKTTTLYPLQYHPIYEGDVQGELLMKNRSNNAENRFLLKGLGLKPLPLDDILIECMVNESTMKVVDVPNILRHKMVFQAFSDLPMVSAPPYVPVLPAQTVHFPLTVHTTRRGEHKGVISFVYDAEFVESMGLDKPIDSDSDEDEESTENLSPISSLLSTKSSQRLPSLPESHSFKKPCRLWYAVQINATPSPAEKCCEMTAAIQSSSTMELMITNPLDNPLELDVLIEGDCLHGNPTISLQPRQQAIYQVVYMPITVGASKGSVIFQSDSVGEFWYDLSLNAESPVPIHLPTMHCTLGGFCETVIQLHNVRTETVTYQVSCSNTNNFSVGCNREIQLAPVTTLDVPVRFIPSSLGRGNHNAEIVFVNDTMGELKYLVTGEGGSPVYEKSSEREVIANLGGNASTIIPFQNPFDVDVLVDVDITAKPTTSNMLYSLSAASGEEATPTEGRVFTLLLKTMTRIPLAPRGILDIPISFSPDTMQRQECTCTVRVQKQDGASFLDEPASVPYNKELRWVYEIKGIPKSEPVADSQAALLECRARERLEECVEISFTGINPSLGKSAYSSLLRSLSPIHLLGTFSPPTCLELGAEYTSIMEEFTCRLEYPDSEIEEDLSRSVAVTLKRKLCHKVSGIISLLFDVVLAPHRPFNHLVHLVISSSSGGIWRFPFRFAASDPAPDDVIIIESTGLNSESSIAFRLTSQLEEACPFEAFFASGSDPSFTVHPLSGHLLPGGSLGTPITVIYKPTYYGKTHQAKLLVQAPHMQWTYDLKGVTPDYTAPKPGALTVNRDEAYDETRFGAHAQPRKKNFIRQNLKMHHTGVSSPLKGNPLVNRTAK